MAKLARIAPKRPLKPSPTPYLLDVNVLIALAWPLHVHHVAAHNWFENIGQKSWATCPLTQLAFVRISSNVKIIPAAVSPRAATKVLREIIALPGHIFWPDDLAVNDLTSFTSNALVGHRQVSDAYLIELAKRHKAKLATLDAGLADLSPESERSSFIAFIGVV